MKKRFIISAVIVIVLFLSGLVSIQLYWINNAIKLKESNFKRSVSEAVTNTIHKLEKIEIANQIRNRFYGTKHDASIFSTLDSINALFVSEMENMLSQYTISGESEVYTSEKISITISEYEAEKGVELIDTALFSVDTVTTEVFRPIQPQDITTESFPPDFSDSISKQIDAFLRKTFIFSDVFEDIFCLRQYQNIQNRINMNMLDSILSIELRQKGINAYFEYGIYNPVRKQFSFERTGNYSPYLLEKGYAFNLFPTDLFVTPEYFLIYFPYQKRFLLTSMWVMVFVSILLIVLMVLSFIYAVSTIIKQRRLSEMKNDFINNMTHEFKTPVSTIGLACEALQDKQIEKSPELYKTYLDIINQENKRLGLIAENVLQTAIIDKGRLKLKIEEVDVHKIIDETVKTLEMQIKKQNAKVNIDTQADNPIILGDAVHLRNVFSNLLDNALKYTLDTPVINIKTTSYSDGILFSITDNGMGISKANQKRVFERLYRVPLGNLHNVKGFGLGLSYVKTIVEMHGGSVSVESELRKGATFYVKLPFTKNSMNN